MAISRHTSFDRCFDIIVRMQAGQAMNAQTIAGLYGLHIRSAHRVLNSIEASLPVVATRECPLTLKLMEK